MLTECRKQALANTSVDDFLVVEYNSDIGGRVAHTNFGKKADGGSYVVELGANWVQGLVSKGGPENPIWTLTFNASGAHDFTDLLNDYDNSYSTLEEDAGYILTDNLQDRSVRTGLSLSGWNPRGNAEQQAAEWWQFDWEYAQTPINRLTLRSPSQNTTFYQFSEANNYVYDQRGFSTFIKGIASTYLAPSDPRLLLNTVVTNITHSSSGVTIHTSNASNPCITASYAILTFSLGVLQNAITPPANTTPLLSFHPALPSWKQTAIQSMPMATYTKIFLQFPLNATFWPHSTQFFLYADPTTRGYYPLWQSLDTPGFLPGSGILFVTVVDAQSYTVEAQSDETTKSQVLAVLRNMFGAENVPEPLDFLVPRWTTTEWARGSYSNWGTGLTLEMHQNLRANVGRLWFAGEATHPEYYGFLQGAWFEGQRVGTAVAGLVKGESGGANASDEIHYDTLHGTTPEAQYAARNGWE
ncbi:MAG: hypothetical protein LQ340_002405, partial [Diploschistes diacapsis]